MATKKGRLRAVKDRFPSRNLDKCHTIVEELAALECPSRLTPDDYEAVICILEKHGATRGDFTMLDEKPGYFGYEYPVTLADGTRVMREWHWKLRQTRNNENRLFEVLL